MTAIPLIPRKLILPKPDREAVRLSPDGTRLAWRGGRCEPIGTDFQDSSLPVRAGAEAVPELAQTLAAISPAV